MRHWSRRHKPTQRLIKSQAQAINRTTTDQAIKTFDSSDDEGIDYDTDVYHGADEYEIQREMADPIAFTSSADPDVMYLPVPRKQPDRKEFLKAMVDEVTTHTKRGHWKIIQISERPCVESNASCHLKCTSGRRNLMYTAASKRTEWITGTPMQQHKSGARCDSS